MNYRKEVDGLRALAVLPVILFHAGFETFSGGFVGVDVFFVISGYLITSILVADLAEDRFSIVHFYERRARRILPALFFVMAVCLPLAWWCLLPKDLRSFSTSLAAVSLFVSNVLFWLQSGYFGTAAQYKPLLHTWSLAVEEQFYVLFPLLLLFFWRFGRRWLVPAIAMIALASLAAAQWVEATQPDAAFFLLPSRAWELAIGALLAIYLTRSSHMQRPETFDTCGAALGFLLIATSVFVYDSATPFPGIHALLPTIGAALIILCANPRNFVGRLLSSAPLVGIGVISYSAYLWHQPLFAFARTRMVLAPGKGTMGWLVVGSLALAWLTYKLVETPFRMKKWLTRRQVFALSAVGSLCFLGLGIFGYLRNGFADRLTPDQREVYAFTDYSFGDVYRARVCHLLDGQTSADFAPQCAGTAATGGAILWGDSHAAALSYGLRSVLPGLGQYTVGACPPILGVHSNNPVCAASRDFVLAKVTGLQPAQIFLDGAWYDYRERWREHDLVETIARIHAVSPHTEVILVGGVPEWEPTLPAFLIRHGIGLRRETMIAMPLYDKIREIDGQLARVAKTTGSRFVSVLNAVCEDKACLGIARQEDHFDPTAWDAAHLTAAGSLAIAGRLARQEKLSLAERH